MDVEVWLCPDEWVGRGLKSAAASGPALSVTRDEDLHTQTLELRLMPEGRPSGAFHELELSLCPEGASELACFLCGYRKELHPSAVVDKMLAVLNEQRAWAACIGDSECLPVNRDWRCDKVAELWLRYEVSEGAGNGPRHYFQQFGMEPSDYSIWEYEVVVPINESPQIKDEHISAMISSFIAGVPGVALKADMNRGGGFFLYNSQTRIFTICLVIAADESEHAYNPEENPDSHPVDLCSFRCAKRLEYYCCERGRGIIFRIQVPDVCHIWRVELVGDIRGIRWAGVCYRQGATRCRGQAFDYQYAGILAGQTFEVNTIGNDPVPGELFAVWAYMDGLPEGACNPVILAWCYYAHPCFTSGTITHICLIDENRQIIESRDSGSTPDEWIGDERLAYQVACEGQGRLVRPSDYYRYSVGERVLIHKGGLHTEKRFVYRQERDYAVLRDGRCSYLISGGWEDFVVAGCQDPDGRVESEIFSWRKVRPLQDDVDGTIVPIKLYGAF